MNDCTPTAEELRGEALVLRDSPDGAIRYLAQRLAAALADADLARSSHAVVTEALRQERAEVERMRAILKPAPHSLGEAWRQRAEALEHKLSTAEVAEKMWREDHQRAIAKLAEAQQRVCELETKPCSTCGNDEKIAKIVRRLGFRPDIGAWRIRELEQREAWWREYAAMKPLGYLAPLEQARRDELRRMLGLDPTQEEKTRDEV